MKRVSGAVTLFALLAAGLWFGGRHVAPSNAIPELDMAAGAAARGAAYFAGAGFGGLSLQALKTHALPWKLVTAALVLDAVAEDATRAASRATLNDVLAGFGFLVQARVANLPDGVADPTNDLPLGITHGTLAPIAGAPVQVTNLGCASCHAGVTYDADGQPDPTAAWIGMPNTSLNLEAYTLAIFQALRSHVDAPDALMDMVATLFPGTGWRERQTLRWLVLPLVRARLDAIDGDRPLPFPNGVPGSTNGVAALKFALDVPLAGGGPEDAGIVSIPDLGHRHWRSSLLADGAYAVPGTARQKATTAADNTDAKRDALAAITTFFTVPSMGVHPDGALDAVPVAKDIFAFLDEAYTPQPFPGRIDVALAERGQAVYAASCADCHGTYEMQAGKPVLFTYPNWLGDVGTDPMRADAFSPALVAAFQDTPYRNRIAVESTRGYAAPPLTGLWASAPYLHNGSVPSVWALLTPEDRPKAFELGGHALDFVGLGLRLDAGRYPERYAPFSKPVIFYTAQPGQGNGGHSFGSDLSDVEKAALIEFLKQL